MHPTIQLFGDFALNSYSLFTTLGAIAFALVCYSEAKRLSFPIESYWRLFFLVGVFAMLGAKLSYAVFFDTERFLQHPVDTFLNTGWMFYGAFIGGYAALFTGRALFNFSLSNALDGMSYGGIFGLGIGRLACFLGGCCGGLPTDSIFGVTFPGGKCAVHPTQLYESIFAFLLFGFITFTRKKFRFDGYQISAVAIGYGLFRFTVEFFREDSLIPGFQPLTPSQYISMALILTGTVIMLVKKRKNV